MPNLPSLPRQAALVDLLDRDPALADALVPFIEHVMHGPSPLSLGQRELIASYVSALNDCRYCRESRQAMAKAMGEDVGVIAHLLEDIGSAPVAENMRPLFRLARVLTLEPTAMTGAHAAAVLDAGWPEEALLSVILVTAQFNFMNRLVEGAGLRGAGLPQR